MTWLIPGAWGNCSWQHSLLEWANQMLPNAQKEEWLLKAHSNVNTLWEGPTTEVTVLSPAHGRPGHTLPQILAFRIWPCVSYRLAILISPSWPALTLSCLGQSQLCSAKITENWRPRVWILELPEIRFITFTVLASAFSSDSQGACTRSVILRTWSLDHMYKNH